MTREEALKIVRENYPHFGTTEPWLDLEKALATLVPELAESKNEKIIRLLRELGSLDAAEELYEEFNLSYTDVLYWLEKQKECLADNSKTSASENERIRKELIGYAELKLKYFTEANSKNDIDRKNQKWWKDVLAYLEKQKEHQEICTKFLAKILKHSAEGFRNVLKKKGIDYIPHESFWISTAGTFSKQECNEFYKWMDDMTMELVTEETPEYKKGFKDGLDASKKEKKPIKIEVYEVGKGTTVCGQDYKCKKDYMTGTCRYIKGAIYHCSRDGYLNDQNGVSWSCTPEWFKEYIQSNTEQAEEEKTRFVSGQFLQCKLSFDEFKEGEHYWLEYIGDDVYVGRSDNVLNQKFHITPRQLYTLFSQQLEEVQGPPQEEKQVSLNYEPPFDENPSDKEIIEALIHHLNEQDDFLTAINCVSTKAILSWLKKQKPVSIKPDDKQMLERIMELVEFCNDKEMIWNWLCEKVKVAAQKPAEWSDEDREISQNIMDFLKEPFTASLCPQLRKESQDWLKSLPERFNLPPKEEWSEEDEEIFNNIIEKAKGGHWIEVNEITWLITRFKSLRRHWKPSEEQMVELNKVRTLNPGLDALYQQLKNM